MDDQTKRFCGAKNRKGEPCRKAPMKGKQRCKMHGGASKAGKNSGMFAHGIYAKSYTAEELSLVDGLADRLGSIDDEITLTRIRLRRAQLAEQKAMTEGGALELSEVRSVTGDGGGAGVTSIQRRTDFEAIIDRLLGRLGMLMKVRAELAKMAAEGDDSVTDKARRLKEALAAMDDAVTLLPEDPEEA